jgi:signal transduction histidine kinase
MSSSTSHRLDKLKHEIMNRWVERALKEVAGDLNLYYKNEVNIKSQGKCLGNWNESALRRVVENLASNAIKYGKPQTPVTISLTEDGSSATLSVHNQGDPMAKEDLSILFQQYRRAKSAEHKIGWGLGLTVVKGVTEAHHGTVEVVSEAGKGTTFSVKLPKNPLVNS